VTVAEAVREAAHSDVPAQRLHGIIKQMLEEGAPRDSVFGALKAAYERLGAEGREDEQDAVAEVLDCFVGYCAAGARL
jgi:hypothetical protein